MEHTLEIAGTLIGLVYLWLEYKASIHIWIVGTLMPALYIVVYYRAGLYADCAINAYYLMASAYGWMRWRYGAARPFAVAAKNLQPPRQQPISHIPPRRMLHMAMLFSAAFISIGVILANYTDSNVPWLDSFTTALSFVGLAMLASKYIEQWLIWMVVDLVSSGLYIYKDLKYTAILYALYALIAIFGYRKWQKMINIID